MDPEGWTRVETLFLRAVELDPAARRSLLEAERARDPELVARVERLLRKDEETSDAFFQALEQGDWRRREDPLPGRELGAYRVTERIASGGMGVVYRAERTDGLFDHAVAIKLIRAERATEALLRRFELERRALAALAHPHIARLYDGGATPEGSPYLVMELVRGLPIDRYCDARRLPIEARLRLFATVCRAVHFAHQNLIVHRDLKPSNVLVDEHGQPKLLDFGIAKILDAGPDEDEATRTLARVLTPEYASPEQLAGGAVTTAIDVYSLGVVLYELLCGSKPFDGRSRSPAEWQRVVAERTPERPSEAARRGRPATTGLAAGEGTPAAVDGSQAPGRARDRRLPAEGVAEIAARRSTTPAALRRRLSGDLDRIVLMALRKEPERRYASAQALAEDVERHLAGQPVHAREDSLFYRASKFVRRNRIQVGAALLVAAAIGAALVATRRSEQRARADAEHARIEAESSALVAELVMDTFLTSSFSADPERAAAARERVRLHAERARLQHPGRPHLRANLLDALGRVALRCDALDDADALVREALALREATFGPRSLEVALSLQSLARLRYERGEPVEAAELLERALELHRALPPGTHTDVASVANDLAVCRRRLGQLEASEALHREALGLRRAQPDLLQVAESLNNLAGIHLDRGERQPALEQLGEALAIRRAVLTSRHPLTLQSMSNLAVPMWHSGDREGAAALLEEAIAGLRELGPDGAEGLARGLSNLAGMLLAGGEPEPAEAHVAEALSLESARLGPGHPDLARLHGRLADVQQARGRMAEARASWERAVALRRAPSGSPLALADTLHSLGRFLLAVRDVEAACEAFAEAVTILRSEPASEPLALGRAELALGECLLALQLPAEARHHLSEAVTLLEPYPVAKGERELALQRLGQLD